MKCNTLLTFSKPYFIQLCNYISQLLGFCQHHEKSGILRTPSTGSYKGAWILDVVRWRMDVRVPSSCATIDQKFLSTKENGIKQWDYFFGFQYSKIKIMVSVLLSDCGILFAFLPRLIEKRYDIMFLAVTV